MVPSMIEATFNVGPTELEEGQKVGLKYLVSGGEKISDSVSDFVAKWNGWERTEMRGNQLLEKWADHPGLILANAYGFVFLC